MSHSIESLLFMASKAPHETQKHFELNRHHIERRINQQLTATHINCYNTHISFTAISISIECPLFSRIAPNEETV